MSVNFSGQISLILYHEHQCLRGVSCASKRRSTDTTNWLYSKTHIWINSEKKQDWASGQLNLASIWLMPRTVREKARLHFILMLRTIIPPTHLKFKPQGRKMGEKARSIWTRYIAPPLTHSKRLQRKTFHILLITKRTLCFFPSMKTIHNGIHSSNTMDSLERGNLSYI